MPKANKKSAKTPVKVKPLYAIAPWSCVHQRNFSIIEAYVEAAGNWEVIAEVRQGAYIDAEATATFIAKAVNDYERHLLTIDELMNALALCLECDGLTWEAEQEAELVMAKVRQDQPFRP